MNKLISFLTFCVIYVESSHILLVSPVPGRSHYILGNAAARILAEAGHNVTIIAAFKDENPVSNGLITQIYLSGAVKKNLEKNVNMFEFDFNPWLGQFFINSFGDDITEQVLSHPNVQNFMSTKQKFDAVIVEEFVCDPLKGFAHYFNAPLIVLSPLGPNEWVNRLVANPSPLSYIPDVVFSYTSDMTFWQKLENVVFSIQREFFNKVLFYPQRNKILKRYFPFAPDLEEITKKVSLVLLNSHVSTSQPVPIVPNMIPIGGYHVEKPKPLPKDLQDYLDNAKDGVIYFSMGSNLNSKDISKDKLETILKVFKKLKQKILWKYENETLPDQPHNVKISKWLPQQDILAHPNVKLFITHGGLLSTTETIYHGIPVLAIPIYGDQQLNAARMASNGFGEVFKYSDLNDANKFEKVLKKLLQNDKYKKNAEKRSKVFHDQQTQPRESLVFWVEYVIRHKGAPHLKVAGVDLPWYQYYLVDVFSFILLVTVLPLVLIFSLCQRRLNKINKSTKKKSE